MAVPQYFSKFLKHYKCHDQFPNDSNYERLKAIVKLGKGEMLKGISRKKRLIVQQKYKIEVIDGEDVLMCRRTGRRILKQSQFLSAMQQCHEQTGHPGRDLTHKKLQEKYVCVPRELIVGFIKNCTPCANRRSILKIVQSEFDDTLVTKENFKLNTKRSSTGSSSVCDNCNLSTENKKLSTITIEDDYSVMDSNVPIWDAIAYIYGLSTKDLQDFAKQYSKKSKSIRIDGTVNLCESCLPLLSENYKFHKKFNDISNSSSVIQQFIEFCKRGMTFADHKFEPEFDQDNSSTDLRTEDHDYGDNLFDDFNFDDDDHEAGSSCDYDNNFREQKYEPYDDTVGTNSETMNPALRVTRGSLKAYVKLEALTEEDYRNIKITSEKVEDILSDAEGSNLDSDSDYHPRESNNDLKRNTKKRKITTKQKSNSPKNRGKKRAPTKNQKPCNKDVESKETLEKSEEGENTNESEASDAKTVHQCDRCEKSFLSKNTLKHHRRIHNDDPSYYNCTICGRSYRQSSYSAFRDHVLSHSGEKRFECPTCNERFQRRSQLDAHKRVHIKDFNFSCEECGKSFKLLGQLNGHKMIHTNEEHTCADCKRCFKSKEYLKIHRKRVHSGQKFVCEECGSTFSQRYSLTLHVKRLHKNELIYECEVCGKHLSSDVRLKTHMWTHTGEKPLVCKFEGCDARYGNKDAFDAHVRSHTGEKFECTVCGKKFDRKQYLKWHSRVHTGERPKKRVPKLKTDGELGLGETDLPQSHNEAVTLSNLNVNSTVSVNVNNGNGAFII